MKEAETVIGNNLRLKEQDPRIAERKASAEKEQKTPPCVSGTKQKLPPKPL